ncbi:MAG: DUF3054 domain-containing protein [Armatimonadota bacterium]|nr:DUF3054 domain-containing protein [Armatimonadota bacterium]
MIARRGAGRGAAPAAARWLPWGDAASLVLFTLVGLRFHRVAITPAQVLETAGPLLAAWFLFARLLGTYARSGRWRLPLTWALAVPVGLTIRQLWLGRPFAASFLLFVGVAGSLTLAFLLVWRSLAWLVWLRGR